MTENSHVDVVLSRLLAVEWATDAGFDFPRARARLMREYLRRTALWAQAYELTDSWPFFDIADALAPDVATPAEPAEKLEALISAKVGWPSVATTCRAALHWAAVLDAGVSIPAELDDPFEPLLLLFERGGEFTTEHGFIDLGGSSVRRQTWRDHLGTEPVVALDKAVLDALDS